MAWMECKFFSESLGMQTEAYVLLPQRQTNGEIGVSASTRQKQYKCLYLLHGLSDDHTIWLRRTSIERYAQKYGICVIMPCGARSFYTDMKYGGKYFTYIAEELPRIMQEFFGISDRCTDNFIAGLSMGGYGALKIALKTCGKFAAAAGISSVADVIGLKERFKEAYKPIWGENAEIPNEDDLFYLAQAKNQNPDKPRIFLGEGTEDFMYAENQKLKAHFEKLDYDFTYKESKGAHSWDFWDEYIQYILEWMFGQA